MMEEGRLPQGEVTPPTPPADVLTPEGEQSLVDRVFDAVTVKIEAQMAEAIKAAQSEASELIKEGMRSGLDSACAAHKKMVEDFGATAKESVRVSCEEATRRMAHATEQVKQAVKDGAELEKRIGDLRSRLFDIAAEAEEQARNQITTAVNEVAYTAEKYKTHVDAAGTFLTKVKDQILALVEELKPIRAFMASCEANGVSPSSLHALMTQVQKLTNGNGTNGQQGRPHWEKRGDRRDRRGA